MKPIAIMALVAFFAVSAQSAESISGSNGGKPNILLIIADDVTCSELSCYGGQNIKTPVIDSLAESGMLFERAYVAQAICAPCRQELYSGLYPASSGAAWNHSESIAGTKSICHYLRSQGYRVGIAGKVHVGPQTVYPFDPVPGIYDQGLKPGRKMPPDNYGPIRKYMADRHSDNDQLFCLVIGFHNAHTPWNQGDSDRIDRKQIRLPPNVLDLPEAREDYARFLAEIVDLDRQVGLALDALNSTGKTEDTLVIFTSEQGGMWPSGKWTSYEQGLKTGVIFRWPGRIRAGRRTDALIQYADVAPTLFEIAGGDPKTLKLDGNSFLPVLLDKSNIHRRYVYGIHNNSGGDGPPYPMRSIRTAEYRYINNLLPDRDYVIEPYNNSANWGGTYWPAFFMRAKENDPRARMLYENYRRRPAEELYRYTDSLYEQDNLADHPEFRQIKQELHAALAAWMEAEQDPGAAMDTEEEYMKHAMPWMKARQKRPK